MFKKGSGDMSDRREELSELMEEQKQAVAKQQKVDSLMNVEMPSSWKLSDKGKEAIALAVGMAKTKHGLYASIPMLCKAEECPYSAVCPLMDMGAAPKGERCPLEIATILKQFEEYKSEFHTDEDNIVDMGFVKDLIDCDIQIFRAENKMAVDGDFLEEVVVTVTEGGEAITNPQISKAAEYKERIQAKKHKILQLMHSTRKDKAGDKLSIVLDPSSYAAQLMEQAQKMGNGIADEYEDDIIDADFSDVEVVDE
jgi:hypothetical protein